MEAQFRALTAKVDVIDALHGECPYAPMAEEALGSWLRAKTEARAAQSARDKAANSPPSVRQVELVTADEGRVHVSSDDAPARWEDLCEAGKSGAVVPPVPVVVRPDRRGDGKAAGLKAARPLVKRKEGVPKRGGFGGCEEIVVRGRGEVFAPGATKVPLVEQISLITKLADSSEGWWEGPRGKENTHDSESSGEERPSSPPTPGEKRNPIPSPRKTACPEGAVGVVQEERSPCPVVSEVSGRSQHKPPKPDSSATDTNWFTGKVGLAAECLLKGAWCANSPVPLIGTVGVAALVDNPRVRNAVPASP